jgi:hypothetical protein
MNKKKLDFSGPIAIIIAILVLIVVVPVNLIVNYYDKVYDMTPSKQYTLNSKTKDLLNDVSDKHIDVYFMYEGLKPLKENPEFLALYHTLSELKKRDNITLTCFDPDKYPDRAAELDPTSTLGVAKGDVFVKCGDVIKRISHSKIFQSSDEEGKLREYAGEELIAGAIKICTSGSLQTMYFLTGHGEKSIDEEYSAYARSVKAGNYGVEELNLDEAGAIPGNTAAIYLVGPQKDITDREKDMLISFLAQGGSVSMLLGPCDTKGRFSNIEEVLRGYGIEMDYNIVYDELPSNQLNDHDDIQNKYYFVTEYPPKTDDFTQDLTTDINYIISKNSRVGGIINTRSLRHLPDTQYDAESIEVCSVIRNVTDINGNYTTVSTAMGGDEITADYADNNLSETQLDFGFYSYNRISGGKLFVIGSNDIIDSTKLPAKYSLATTTLALFSNTWLYDTDIQMGIGNKLTAYDTMNFKDEKEAKRVMGLTTLLPIGLILFGIGVWLKRRHA